MWGECGDGAVVEWKLFFLPPLLFFGRSAVTEAREQTADWAQRSPEAIRKSERRPNLTGTPLLEDSRWKLGGERRRTEIANQSRIGQSGAHRVRRMTHGDPLDRSRGPLPTPFFLFFSCKKWRNSRGSSEIIKITEESGGGEHNLHTYVQHIQYIYSICDLQTHMEVLL